jgi:transcriptional regulator with XRE-family HTH domain
MFGQNLKRLRVKRGLSQVGLAELCGLTSQAVNQIEKGKRWPREERATALAAALGCPLADLYGAPAVASPSDPALVSAPDPASVGA